jgi:hypothetical protein
VSFFRAFSEARYSTADISSYEGAEHIFDICGDVPEELVGRFDFVLDGGSLDNVFDVFAMIRNMSRMLKPGGRMFVNAWSNSFPSAYLKITPDWIMDYCAINDFADCKVYVSSHSSPFGDANDEGGYVDIFRYDPLLRTASGPIYEAAFVSPLGYSSVYCVAEKGMNSTNHRTAVQKHYRGPNVAPYVAAAERFSSSRRPIFARPGQSAPQTEPISRMPTVRPVARFGVPQLLSFEEYATSMLRKIETELSKFNEAVPRELGHLDSRIYQTGQEVLSRMYVTVVPDIRSPSSCHMESGSSLAETSDSRSTEAINLRVVRGRVLLSELGFRLRRRLGLSK